MNEVIVVLIMVREQMAGIDVFRPQKSIWLTIPNSLLAIIRVRTMMTPMRTRKASSIPVR